MKIPNRITNQRMAILKIVAEKKGNRQITTKEINEKLGSLSRDFENTKAVVSQMSDKKQITKIKFGVFEANEVTAFILKHRDQIAIVDYKSLIGNGKGKRNAKAQQPQDIPKQQTLDISPIHQSSVGVDTVMSAVDDLVKENSSLRAGMITAMKSELETLNKLRALLGYGPLVEQPKEESEK